MSATKSGSELGKFEGQLDLGATSETGSAVYDAAHQVLTLTAPDGDFDEDNQACHYVWKKLRGDFILTVRITDQIEIRNPNQHLGWIVRGDLSANAPRIIAAVDGKGQPSFAWHSSLENAANISTTDIEKIDVLQLERHGQTLIYSAAAFGQPFEVIRQETIELGQDLYVGLFVQAGAGKVSFDNIRLVKPVAEGFTREKDPFGSRMEILDVASGHRKIIYETNEVFEAPNWSRDGSHLIFNRKGHLFRFELEKKLVSQILTGIILHNNNDHVLSFDGSRLAISSHNLVDGHSRIYTLPSTGGVPKLITPQGPSYLHGWSPDGKYLVFTGLRRGDFDIYRISVEGGKETQLTTAPGLDDGPEYTPDGRFIYFNSVRSGPMQIWRMKPDGSDQEQVTHDAFNNWFPHITPDGKQMIFISYLASEVAPDDHPPAKHVYLRMMPIEGGEPKVVAYLYGGQGTMNVPSWSPEGKRVAFVSNTVPF